MIVLGVGSPYPHDPSAAIYVDGRLVAAAEEERFTRQKHAEYATAEHAARFCLERAGVKPGDVDCVAFPWSYDWHRDRQWASFGRLLWTYPSRAFKSFLKTPKVRRTVLDKLNRTLIGAGFDPQRTRIEFVPHHIAHAASSFFPSGFKRAAVLSFDGSGEFTAGLAGRGEGSLIHVDKEWIWPDSLGAMYTTFTEYCGFERNDGEYRLMGMAPYGKPGAIDFSGVATLTEKTFRLRNGYYHCPSRARYRDGANFSRTLVTRWGPPREGDELSEPHIHVAYEAQHLLEQVTIRLMETYLADELRVHGRLCFAGGVALNVSLNRKLIAHPLVKELWVCPAAGDSGTPLGAAAYVAARGGDRIETMRHPFLGPDYTEEEISDAVQRCTYSARKVGNISHAVAELLYRGEIVGWFQGRMEFGPRALGGRSILANPAVPGTADRINEIIKFREKWRPFCPSLIRDLAPDFVTPEHESPFMTFGFDVSPKWRTRVPEVVHVDGTARPQFVDRRTQPRFYALIEEFYRLSGIPIVINTSLNRRGEPMVSSPKDAIGMLQGSGLRYLAMGDWLIQK